jgi:hypothetical protein
MARRAEQRSIRVTTLHAPSRSGSSQRSDSIEGSVTSYQFGYPPAPPPWLPTTANQPPPTAAEQLRHPTFTAASSTHNHPMDENHVPHHAFGSTFVPSHGSAKAGGQGYGNRSTTPSREGGGTRHGTHHLDPTPRRSTTPTQRPMPQSTTFNDTSVAHPIGFTTSSHLSLTTSALSRDASLADQLKAKDRLLEQCLRDKRTWEAQYHQDRVAWLSDKAQIRMETYNEFMQALRHGGIVAVEALGQRIAAGGEGGGTSSPKQLPNGDSGMVTGQSTPYFRTTTPLPSAKTNPRAREEATMRVRNALALLQQPRSTSLRSV